MTHEQGHEKLILTKEEAALVTQIAKMHQVSEEEAAALVIKRGLEDRVRKRTGKGPAKVYAMPRKS